MSFESVAQVETNSVWIFMATDTKEFDSGIEVDGVVYKPDKIRRVFEWDQEEENRVGLAPLDSNEIVEFVTLQESVVEILSTKV